MKEKPEGFPIKILRWGFSQSSQKRRYYFNYKRIFKERARHSAFRRRHMRQKVHCFFAGVLYVDVKSAVWDDAGGVCGRWNAYRKRELRGCCL